MDMERAVARLEMQVSACSCDKVRCNASAAQSEKSGATEPQDASRLYLHQHTIIPSGGHSSNRPRSAASLATGSSSSSSKQH